MKISIFLISLICNIMCNVLGQDCNFDNDNICNWIQSSQDDGNWRITLFERSTLTGPPNGHTTTSENYYCYLDAEEFKDQSNSVIPNKSAILISPELNGSGNGCFRFFYYMYGEDINTLSVGVVNSSQHIDDTSRRELFRQNGNQGKQWFCGRINFNFSNFERIYIEAKTGITFASNVAVDDLSFVTAAECATALPCNSTKIPTTTSDSNTVTSVTPITDLGNNTQTDSGVTVGSSTTPDPGSIDVNFLLFLISIPVALLLALSIVAIVCYCKKSKNTSFNDNQRNKNPTTIKNLDYVDADQIYHEISNVSQDPETEYSEPHDANCFDCRTTGLESRPYDTISTRQESDSSGNFRIRDTNTGRFGSKGTDYTDFHGSRGFIGDDSLMRVPQEKAPGRPELPPRVSQNYGHTITPPTRCIGPQSTGYIRPL